MGLGFGKWKHSPEIWTELGPQNISLPCPVSVRETWLGWGVPRTHAGDAGIAKEGKDGIGTLQACPSLYTKYSQEKEGKEGPSPEPSAQTDRERAGVASCHFNLSGRRHPPASAAAPSPAPKSWEKGEKTAPTPVKKESHLHNPLGIPSFTSLRADEHGPRTACWGVPFCGQQGLEAQRPLSQPPPASTESTQMPTLVLSAEFVAGPC